eukprot:TRINITY_DN6231_c1_g1_i1.p1 TRINITY_DN6231_c1_g1~~TRINITY_DN6231_c1_g1_i1.p1  ORF type:complete len:1750 (+),score=551.35 TRINITY_DN6231_c1_g1_i1:49-5298(+)
MSTAMASEPTPVGPAASAAQEELRAALPSVPQNIDSVPALQFSSVQREDEFRVEQMSDEYYKLCMEKDLKLDTQDDSENMLRVQQQEIAQKDMEIKRLRSLLVEREAAGRKDAVAAVRELLRHINCNLEAARLRICEMLDMYISREEREAAQAAAAKVSWFCGKAIQCTEQEENGSFRRRLDEIDLMFRFFFEEVHMRWSASRSNYILIGGVPGADYRMLWQKQRGQISALNEALRTAAVQVDADAAKLKTANGSLVLAKDRQSQMRQQYITELLIKTEKIHELEAKLAALVGPGFQKAAGVQLIDFADSVVAQEKEEKEEEEDEEELARKRNEKERDELRKQLLQKSQQVSVLEHQLRNTMSIVEDLRAELTKKWYADEDADMSTQTPTPREPVTPPDRRVSAGKDEPVDPLAQPREPLARMPSRTPPPDDQRPPSFSPHEGQNVEVWCDESGENRWVTAVIVSLPEPGEDEFSIAFEDRPTDYWQVDLSLLRPIPDAAASSSQGSFGQPFGAAKPADDMSDRSATETSKRKPSARASNASMASDMVIEVENPKGMKTSGVQHRKSVRTDGRRGSTRIPRQTSMTASEIEEEKSLVRQLQEALADAEERVAVLEKDLALKSQALAELEAEKNAHQQRRKMSTRGSVMLGVGGGRRGAHEEIEELTEDNMRLRKELAELRGELARLEDAGSRATADAMKARDGELEEAVRKIQQLEAVNEEFRHLNNILRDQLLTAEERATSAEDEAQRWLGAGQTAAAEAAVAVHETAIASKFLTKWQATESKGVVEKLQEERKQLVEDAKKARRRTEHMRMVLEDSRSNIMRLRAAQRSLIADFRAFKERHRDCTIGEPDPDSGIDARLRGQRGAAGESTMDILRRIVLEDLLVRNRLGDSELPIIALVTEALERGKLPAEYLLHFLTSDQLQILHEEAVQIAPEMFMSGEGAVSDASAEAAAHLLVQRDQEWDMRRAAAPATGDEEVQQLREELRMLKETLGEVQRNASAPIGRGGSKRDSNTAHDLLVQLGCADPFGPRQCTESGLLDIAATMSSPHVVQLVQPEPAQRAGSGSPSTAPAPSPPTMPGSEPASVPPPAPSAPTPPAPSIAEILGSRVQAAAGKMLAGTYEAAVQDAAPTAAVVAALAVAACVPQPDAEAADQPPAPAEQQTPTLPSKKSPGIVDELLKMPLDDVLGAAPNFLALFRSLPGIAQAGVRKQWAVGAAAPSSLLRDAVAASIEEGIIPTEPDEADAADTKPVGRQRASTLRRSGSRGRQSQAEVSGTPPVDISAVTAATSAGDFAAGISPSQLSTDGGSPQVADASVSGVAGQVSHGFVTPPAQPRSTGWPMRSAPVTGPVKKPTPQQRLAAATSRLIGIESLRATLTRGAEAPVPLRQRAPSSTELTALPSGAGAWSDELVMTGTTPGGPAEEPREPRPVHIPNRPLNAVAGIEVSAKRRMQLEEILLDTFDGIECAHEYLDIFELFALIKIELLDLLSLQAQLTDYNAVVARQTSQTATQAAAELEQDRKVLLGKFKIFRALETYTSLILLKMRRRKESLLRTREEVLTKVLQALGHVAQTHPKEARELLCVAQRHGRGDSGGASSNVPLLVQLSRRADKRQDDLREALLSLAGQESEKLRVTGGRGRGSLLQRGAMKATLSPLPRSEKEKLLHRPRTAPHIQSEAPAAVASALEALPTGKGAGGFGFSTVPSRATLHVLRGRVKPAWKREGRGVAALVAPAKKKQIGARPAAGSV